MDEDRARYLDIEQMVKCELRDAERVYVNGILHNGLESGNNKPFWKYVKSQKQETFGISALKIKKGSKLRAVNYRPVSLTCITCKLFEHIICKHILAHLEDHKILTDLQHGFRSGSNYLSGKCTTKKVVKLTLPF